MIALDTNILLRFSTGDDPKQATIAKRFFDRLASERETAFIAAVTLAEFVWVLQKRYRVQPNDLSRALEPLLNVPNLTFEHEGAVRRAAADGPGDFSDRLIHFIGAAAGCQRTVTFDRAFAKLDGVELLGR